MMIDREQLRAIADAAEQLGRTLADALHEQDLDPGAQRADAEWPEDGTLFWVRGLDRRQPVEGFAILSPLNGGMLANVVTGLDGVASWTIWRASLGKTDELFECTSLVAVPRDVMNSLLNSDPNDGVWGEIDQLNRWRAAQMEGGQW